MNIIDRRNAVLVQSAQDPLYRVLSEIERLVRERNEARLDLVEFGHSGNAHFLRERCIELDVRLVKAFNEFDALTSGIPIDKTT